MVILQFFYRLSGDYGLAIILLTVTVRVILLPLTIKQTKSMQDMKRIQPLMKELQEKYKDNKEKLQEEMMKFYKENKVNPLAGCLPLLLQLPIMFALFRVLIQPPKGQTQSFFVFISDLSVSAQKAVSGLGVGQAIPYLVLVLLLIASTYVQSRMMSADAQQEKMMIFMSLFMAYIGWTLPAGVLLYLVVSNAWTIAQQYVSSRGTEPATEGS